MKRKQILLILIPTAVFVIIWIISSIYHGIATSTISQTENVQIVPISANFDTKTLENLKKREVVTPITQINGTTNPSVPTPTATPAQVSTQSAQEASAGGTLQ